MSWDLWSSTREHQWTWKPEQSSTEESSPSVVLLQNETAGHQRENEKPTDWFIPAHHPSPKEVCWLILLYILGTVPVTAEIGKVELDLPQRDALKLQTKQRFRKTEDGNLLLTALLQSSGMTRPVTQASTNLWQTCTHDSTTVNHWTLLPDKKTWKNRTDEATQSHPASPLLTMPGEISSPLPHHGTAPWAKPAAPPFPLEVK